MDSVPRTIINTIQVLNNGAHAKALSTSKSGKLPFYMPDDD